MKKSESVIMNGNLIGGKRKYYTDADLSMDCDDVVERIREDSCNNNMKLIDINEKISSIPKTSSGLLNRNNRIEIMAYENYSLRKRCKRLENIVSQLLHKGDVDSQFGSTNQFTTKTSEQYNEIIQRNASPKCTKLVDEKTIDRPAHLGAKSVSVSSIKTSEQSPDSSPRVSPYSDPFEIFHYSMRVPSWVHHQELDTHTKLATSKHSVPCIHTIYPTPVENKTHLVNKISLEKTSNGRRYSLEENERSFPLKIESEILGDKELTAEEMELRNEHFRSTYYEKQERKTQSIPYKDIHDTRKSSSLPLQYKTLSLNHSSSHEQAIYQNNLPAKKVFTFNETTRFKDKTSTKVLQYPSMRSKPLTCGSQKTNQSKISQKIRPIYTTISPPPVKSTYIHPIRNLQSGNHQRMVRSSQQFRPNLIQTDSRLLITNDNDLQINYNSDFYTKLPPKLHIVESQNENGVTLTWNTTSNCDSSLVKSYQLFARELFGQKVGTMKRIGIVEALPLPMSCNIDKLKYQIKYKFAVCAVDLYGRFGKMSNFTGKFELKPKGPVQHKEQFESKNKDVDENSDLEVDI